MHFKEIFTKLLHLGQDGSYTSSKLITCIFVGSGQYVSMHTSVCAVACPSSLAMILQSMEEGSRFGF